VKVPASPPDPFEIRSLWKLLEVIFEKSMPSEPERVVKIKLSPELSISEWYIMLCSAGPPPWWDRK